MLLGLEAREALRDIEILNWFPLDSDDRGSLAQNCMGREYDHDRGNHS
jgi:hypothetical protein